MSLQAVSYTASNDTGLTKGQRTGGTGRPALSAARHSALCDVCVATGAALLCPGPTRRTRQPQPSPGIECRPSTGLSAGKVPIQVASPRDRPQCRPGAGPSGRPSLSAGPSAEPSAGPSA